MPQLEFREVDERRWHDLVALFESRGGPKTCWCMYWRGTAAKQYSAGAERRAALEERVRARVPVGILGYLEQKPVAWCSVAPRGTYRPLGGAAEPGEHEDDIWSIVCFFLRRTLRGCGLGRSLIQAAVEHARAKRAKVVETYPVEPDSPSYRFMGFVPKFEAAGFKQVGRAGVRRHVMRLYL